MRQRWSLFAGLLVVAAVTAGVPAGVVGFLSSSATIGVRGVLESMPGADLALVIAMPYEGDSAKQSRVTMDTFRATFRDGARTIPIAIESSVETVVAVATPHAQPDADDADGQSLPRVAIATASHLQSDADLVSGRWGAAPGEVTLQADAAAALGVAPGDTLSIGDTDVTLVGTWRVADPDAARWMGDERWTTGASGNAVGPLIIDPSLWSAVDDAPWMHWAVIPDVTRIEATDLAAIEAAWAATPEALMSAGLDPGSRSGQFLNSTQELRARLAALQTAVPLALVIFGAIAALTLWELAGLAARTRATEMSLLWSRGATAPSLSARAAGEAVAVTAIGCIAGVGVAALTLWALRGVDAAASVASAGVWSGGAAIAVSAVAFAVRTSRTANAGEVAERAGRTRRFAGVGAVVLLLIAAALSTWQLLTYGPVTRTARGAASVDPLTVVAPALLLASVVLLGLYAFPVLAGLAERAAVRTKTGNALAVRNVSRRIGAAAATIVMIGLAVGQLAFAAGYGATWGDSFAQAQELRAGTAVRLDGPSSGISGGDIDGAASADGVVGVAPARTASITIGGEQANLLGLAAPVVAALAESGRGLIDVDALAESIAPLTALPLLPEDATTVTIDVGTSPAAAASVWLSDEWGRLENVPLTPVAAHPGTATAELPTGRAPWRLSAVDLSPTGAEASGEIAVESITTDAGDVDPLPSASVDFPAHSAAGNGTDDIVRMLPASGVGAVAVSEWLAERIGAKVGSPLTLSLSSSAPPVEAVVTAVVPAIPGSRGSSAILTDASVVDAALLRTAAAPDEPSSLWVGSRDAAASARALRDELPSSITVRELGAEPDQIMLAAGAASLWIAAAAGAILAITGLIAVCAIQHRERRTEIGVLRALGLSAADQARVRRRELALVTAWGAVCGLTAGAVSLLVVVATLARAAIPGAYSSIATPPRLDLLAGGVALLALGVAAAVVIALAGEAVARIARSGATLLGDA